jgi:antitoxin component YwqK of YwqJK toxin-antitoxin module
MKRALFAAYCTLSVTVHASGNLIYYNGTKFDDRYSKPEHFTGEYSMRDMDTGKVTLVERHVDGVAEGPFAKYDSRTGQLEESGTMRRGKRHGLYQRYNNKGKLQDEYTYVDGAQLGVQKSYDDGVLETVYSVTAVRGGRDVSFSFNKKGQLTQLECGTRSIGKDDAAWCGRDGKVSLVTLYDDEGRVRATQQYQWGRLHGMSRRLHVVTGKVMTEAKFVRGVEQKDGQKDFDAQGELRWKSDCDEARAACTETQFFDGGKEVQSRVVFKGGKLFSRTDFFQNGKPREEVVREGEQFVVTRSDDEGHRSLKGRFIQSMNWRWTEWMPDGEVEHFDEDGHVWLRERYRKGLREGRREYMWIRDKHALKEEGEYKDDKLLRTSIFVDGKLAAILEYAPDGSLKSKKTISVPEGLSVDI